MDMRKESQNWLEQGEEDFDTAKLNHNFKKYYIAVFLCQQATEKSLKSLFIEKNKTTPGTTHSLMFLAKNTKVPEKFYDFLKRLTPEFVNTRYPDAAYETPGKIYSETISQNYINKTEELLKWIKLQIKK